MEQDAWTVSVKIVNGEVVVDQIIPFEDDFPDDTWVFNGCIWATEQTARTVAQKRINARKNQRAKNVIFRYGELDKIYSVQEFIDLYNT